MRALKDLLETKWTKPKLRMWWKKHRISLYCLAAISIIWSNLRDMVVEKNRGEWKKFGVEGKNIFFNVLHSLTKHLRSLEKLCIPSQNVCVLSQNFCILSQRYLRFFEKLLHSLAKFLRSLAKAVEFGETLPVYFTACGGSYSSVCSQWNGS